MQDIHNRFSLLEYLSFACDFMALSVSCMKLLVTCLLMVVALQICVEASEFGDSKSIGLQTSGLYRRLLKTMDCKGACGKRCKAASRTKMCLRACGTCCERCNCVPPGTSGNTHICPCYANMRTHGNRLKCP